MSAGEKTFKKDSRPQYKKARKILMTTIESVKIKRLPKTFLKFIINSLPGLSAYFTNRY
jgi:hypothetical protein